MKDWIAKIRGEYYRIKCNLFKKNIFIDKGLRIYGKFEIIGKGKVTIGKNCIISRVIGYKNCHVVLQTLNPNAIIKIGDNVSLFGARISSKFAIKISNDVLIEDSSIMDTDFHSIDKSKQTPSDENVNKCKIVIGNRVSIGARSIITKGVNIGHDSIVAPGSIVRKSVPPRSLVFGNPASFKQIPIQK